VSVYENAINAHQKYTLQSLADLDSLATKVSRDLKATNAIFKITLVDVSADVPNS
jgi:hypothetical protein